MPVLATILGMELVGPGNIIKGSVGHHLRKNNLEKGIPISWTRKVLTLGEILEILRVQD
jgi:hypothetical protein